MSSFELTPSVWLFAENDDFVGKKLENDPRVDIEIGTTADKVNGKRRRSIEKREVVSKVSDKYISLGICVWVNVRAWVKLLGAGGLQVQV